MSIFLLEYAYIQCIYICYHSPLCRSFTTLLFVKSMHFPVHLMSIKSNSPGPFDILHSILYSDLIGNIWQLATGRTCLMEWTVTSIVTQGESKCPAPYVWSDCSRVVSTRVVQLTSGTRVMLAFSGFPWPTLLRWSSFSDMSIHTQRGISQLFFLEFGSNWDFGGCSKR